MVIDTSALLTMLLREAGAPRVVAAVAAESARRMSAASLVEAGIVVQARLGDDGERELDALLDRLHVTVIPFTVDHVALARSAFRRFGKGRHPAGLNFGDCFSYALARTLDEPLLFVGNDFARTDVRIASY